VRPKSTQKLPRIEGRISSVRASLDELFPFHIAFDRDLVVLQTGRSLRHLAPDVVPGVKLDKVLRGSDGFDPRKVTGEATAHLSMRIPRTKLVLRGMVVETEHDGILAFLPSVWPSRSQEVEALPLEREDFAPFDPTYEFVQELSTREALQGNRRSADVLAEQRAELRRANRRLEALYGVSQVLDRATTLEAAIGDVVTAVADALRAHRVRYWNVGDASLDLLALHESERSDDGADPSLAQKAQRSGQRQERGDRIAHPVASAKGVFGVLEVEGAETDEDGIQLCEEIARNLGLFIDKRHADAEILRTRDEAQAATKLKSAFLANMSHEVRTPLNAIIGMMDLVLAGELGRAEREYVQLAQSAGRDLLRIVNDILDFSKVEAGQLETESVEFDLADLVQRLVLQHSTVAREKRLKLHASYEPTAPRWLRGDPIRIGQVLGNLVSNAIKFTDEGEVWLRVRPSGGGKMRFEVTDTGAGIPESARGTLFAPFRQADSSTTRRYGGTGLGLAIARALCEKMGGNLDFSSVRGKGSTFFFELPLPMATPPVVTDATPRAQPEARPARRSHRTVLVAEDNPVNQRLLRGFLEHLGFDAHIVGSGEKVVEAARNGKYAAVLMDWQMPVMDGLEATRRIRAEEKGKKPVPIIALTAHALRGDRERCLAAGMNDYLTKPVRLDELRATLDNWAGNRSKTSSGGSLPPIAATPGVDLASLRALGRTLGAEDASLIAEVVGVYLEDAPLRLERLRAALSAGDKREAARQAHTLKGASSNVCAEGLVKLAAAIEQACKDDRLTDARSMLVEATRELDRVAPVLKKAVRL
jgi:signal transduction histidine kinase/DNA-binding response OmpR family regulator